MGQDVYLFPLSYAQQRLWLLEQIEPGNCAYHIPLALTLTGELNHSALERSLAAILKRHETLRTSFRLIDGQPTQVISLALSIELPLVDLSHLPQTMRSAQARRYMTEYTRQPFDFARAPLFRAALFKLDETEHVLFLMIHHIIADGWSLNVLFREIARFYRMFTSGNVHDLAERPIQYADFAVWEHQQLQGATLAELLSYWTCQLQGVTGLELATDHPRPAVYTFQGQMREFRIAQQATEALKALGSSKGVTLYMLLLAAFDVLLCRYTSQEDIVLGSPIASRNQAELEDLIGFFANTLVLRVDLSGNPAFSELLHRVRKVTLAAYDHQDLPFEKLVEALNPKRDLSRNPLVNVMFAMEYTDYRLLDLPGLDVQGAVLDNATAKVDLTLFAEETEQGLLLKFEYNTDLFDAPTIERMSRHFQNLLLGILHNPDTPIWQLPLLDDLEQQQILGQWNATQREYPRDACVQHIFEAQVQRTPDAVAVVDGEQTITYRQLNARANQLARYLRRQQLTAGDYVGVCFERSIELIVGMLAILKAGCTYVPLDPNYPAERLAAMVEDAQIATVLTSAALSRHLSSQLAVNRVELDREWATILAEDDHNLELPGDALSAAYVMFTSGSTGRPKGIPIPHRGINRLVINTNYIKFEPGDRVAQASTPNFDASTFEIWGALLNGAQLVITPREVVLSPHELAQFLSEQHITTLFLTTALLHQFARELPTAFQGLRNLVFGGEAADARLVQTILAHTPPERMINGYGPTESTTFATCYEVGVLDEHTPIVPIGKPISNTQVYVLDRYLQPVPIGVIGEMYIGGDGLAPHYLNRPDLTRKRFISNPYSSEPNARLYKTGDLARLLPDGTIAFVGRADHQVKIRGYRIELGEIEAVLRQHPNVGEAQVLVQEDVPGSKRLAAFIVARDQGRVPDRELREHLRRKLPEHMLPASFHLVDTFPLTPNGKVDRQALLALLADVQADPADQPMMSPHERALAEIWQEVLGVAQLSAQSDFFDIGGHSLAAMQVVAKARQRQIPISLKQIYQAPTLSELARMFDAPASSESSQERVTGEVPLMPQHHAVFPMVVGREHRYVAWSFLECAERLDLPCLTQAFQHLLEQHDALRSRFTSAGAAWRQHIISQEPHQIVGLVDLSDLSEPEQARAIKGEGELLNDTINLVTGPVIRALLIRRGQERPDLLLVMVSHFVADGISLDLLIEDLEQLYVQLTHGQTLQLPPKTTSIKHFAERLHEFAASEQMRPSLDYWLKIDPDRLPALPYDRTPSTAAPEHEEIERVTVTLAKEYTKTFLQGSAAGLATPRDVLVSSLMWAYRQWSGNELLLFKMSHHGRNMIFSDVDVSRTVGFITAAIPFCLDIAEAATPAQTLRAVKAQLKRAPDTGIFFRVGRAFCGQDLEQRLAPFDLVDLSFNFIIPASYFSESRSLFRQVHFPLSLGVRFPSAPRLMIYATLNPQAELQCSLNYDARYFSRATIGRLADELLNAFRTFALLQGD